MNIGHFLGLLVGNVGMIVLMWSDALPWAALIPLYFLWMWGAGKIVDREDSAEDARRYRISPTS